MPQPELGQNLLTMFRASAERQGQRPFLWAKKAGAFTPLSWREVQDQVERLARGLAALGLARGDRVFLLAENRPEWCIADLAIMRAGGITVPSYATSTAEDHRYIIEHAGTRFAIFSGAGLAKRLMPAAKKAGTVERFIAMDGLEGGPEAPAPVTGWDEALRLGESAAELPPIETIDPDETACFIYTSGTGGRPKAVMLTHRNIMANIVGAIGVLEHIGLDKGEVFLSFLPLSHSYEHTAGQFFPIAIGAEIYYAEGVEHLASNLTEVRPTILTCVPRLYEVLRHRITTGVHRQGGWRARLFEKAVELGSRRYEEGGLPFHLDLFDRLLDRLVRRKVRARFGGRLKALVSGGAPLNYEVGLFFVALGLPVLQGYGQTEASPLVSVNIPGQSRLDTVGPPVKGVEVRIAEDGEILVRGDNVMKGYWKDEAATAETIRDGWLHTGDIGTIDEAGRIRITDRKKDMIVNSGGDNVSPQRVEGRLVLEPEIGQALVYGDKKPYLVGLIVPDAELVKRHSTDGDADHAAIRKAVAEAVRRANGDLSPIERVRRFEMVIEPFSIDNGFMTPTLKLRRQAIYKHYARTFEALYQATREAQPETI